MGGSALKTVLRISQWRGERDEAESIKVGERGKEGRKGEEGLLRGRSAECACNSWVSRGSMQSVTSLILLSGLHASKTRFAPTMIYQSLSCIF